MVNVRGLQPVDRRLRAHLRKHATSPTCGSISLQSRREDLHEIIRPYLQDPTFAERITDVEGTEILEEFLAHKLDVVRFDEVFNVQLAWGDEFSWLSGLFLFFLLFEVSAQ